jgi:hypothetical protein
MQPNGDTFKTERGCARSVSRSASALLRLVCDTAALRNRVPNSLIH